MGCIMKTKRLGELSRGAMLKATTWLRQEKGSLNVLYALALIPMIGALGLATDTARGYLLKARLSQSIDQAVLAGGKVYFSPERNADVLKYFSANFPHTVAISYDTPFQADFMDAEVTLNSPVAAGVSGSETLHLTATATIPTTFMRVLNAVGCTSCNEMTVFAESEVERTIRAVDAVISLDMSGSMDGSAKIGAARDGLTDFLNTLYGTGVNTSPTLTVSGTTYNLINVGFVPWNSKTNVKTQGATSTTVTTQTVASYTNPVTLATGQTTVWKSALSEVPLLMNPRDTSSSGQLPGGWSGCVYARYVGGEATPGSQNNNTNSVNTNDADLVKGAQFDVGSGSTQKDWPAWEPMSITEAEPRSGSWSNGSPDNEPNTTRWRGANSAGAGYTNRSCTLAYFNDYRTSSNTYTADENNNMDAVTPVNGAIQSGTQATVTNTNTTPALPVGASSRPVSVPAITAPVSATYSGTMRFFNDNTRPAAVPPIGDAPGDNDCSPCLTRSIIPLSPNRASLSAQIGSIANTDPDGNTNILQGMYWAWEVLMPGQPFDQAYVTTPFQRDRYIILITDGAQVGGNGDAYKGRFGSGEIAGDNTDAAHGTISAPVESNSWVYGDPIPAFTTTNNNLDNRLRILSRNVKNDGIKLYIIGFDLADHPNELRMLSALASPPDGDSPQYFYAATTGADLKAALKTIASRLTDVRLSM
jgi:Putative Flp pilus-assembly TadE/G-like